MNTDLWRSAKIELGRWAANGSAAQFWIRDDDACDVTPQLERLAGFARRHGIGVGLAVVPAKMTDALIGCLREPDSPFMPMCHGWNHTNHGTVAEPGEFGPDRPYEMVQADAVRARDAYAASFGAAPPIFVPPFGCISDELAAALGDLGFAAISNGHTLFEARLVRVHGWTGLLPANPLRRSRQRRLDVHIDPVDWRAKTARSRDIIEQRLLGELRARRKRYIAPERPIGILTHHLVHDEAVWSVCDELVTMLRSEQGAAFPDLEQLLAPATPAALTNSKRPDTGRMPDFADKGSRL